jgi:hypothetical protein
VPVVERWAGRRGSAQQPSMRRADPSVRLFVCLLACLLACLFARLFGCSFVCLLVCSFVWLLVCLFARLLVCLLACLFIVSSVGCLLACLLACLLVCVCLFVCVCVFVCLLACLLASTAALLRGSMPGHRWLAGRAASWLQHVGVVYASHPLTFEPPLPVPTAPVAHPYSALLVVALAAVPRVRRYPWR